MDDPRDDNVYQDSGYALTGKIMLSGIVILFFVVILMVFLHLYARWYLLRARRRHLRRHRHRRTHLVFYVDPVSTASRGLDADVLKSLPVFVYSSQTHQEGLDCAVCLSEFEEGESGRVLPNCKHSFHIECIDMWFQSHSTCPLCRSPVEPGRGGGTGVGGTEERDVETGQAAVSVAEPGSSSGMCDTCRHEVGLVETTSCRNVKRDFVEVSIEVPRRSNVEGFESESNGCESASSQTQSSFRSPVSRMLSFKRILSREKRVNVPPSPSSVQPDIEVGTEENRIG